MDAYALEIERKSETGRVDLGGRPPRPPTDPDVRVKRIWLSPRIPVLADQGCRTGKSAAVMLITCWHILSLLA
jgi:hypothetical protein